eukprot:282616-Amphidinium_carterae.1
MTQLMTGMQTALDQQNNQIQQLTIQTSAQQQALHDMATNHQHTMEAILNRNRGVIDIKQVGKPELFKGNREALLNDWSSWSYMFITWFSSQFQHGEDALEWARDETQTITEDIVNIKATASSWVDLPRINAQLHVALVSLCRDDALTIIRNASKAQGLDAWRKLHREFEPNNAQANLRLLKRVLHPSQQTLDNLRGALETWERELRVYRERTGESLSDPVKRLTLQAMCPQQLQAHLEFHANR